ncbi:hypothetical protein [Sphingomonas sp. ID0503]|uniref:hypothetical protein n=1 Tax=Sphingomonas sp. ID0503 TaxID=3399691 RepID=UPI003AFA7BAE
MQANPAADSILKQMLSRNRAGDRPGGGERRRDRRAKADINNVSDPQSFLFPPRASRRRRAAKDAAGLPLALMSCRTASAGSSPVMKSAANKHGMVYDDGSDISTFS